MERSRVIAAAPVRTAAEAWQVVVDLIVATLERSSAIASGSVAEDLSVLNGLGPALVAGGHLESKGLVLVDDGLHLTIQVVTADAALEVEENLNPVPGGAGATADWMLYIPSCGALDAVVAKAIKGVSHLSSDSPPNAISSNKSVASSAAGIDVEALKRLRGPS